MTTATLPRRSQKSYQYDVYGEVTGGSGSLANEFDFAGQQTDATGLQYLRARYYDPATGTFLSREPLAARTGWLESAFAYAAGRPVRSTDPTGLMLVDNEKNGNPSGRGGGSTGTRATVPRSDAQRLDHIFDPQHAWNRVANTRAQAIKLIEKIANNNANVVETRSIWQNGVYKGQLRISEYTKGGEVIHVEVWAPYGGEWTVSNAWVVTR